MAFRHLGWWCTRSYMLSGPATLHGILSRDLFTLSVCFIGHKSQIRVICHSSSFTSGSLSLFSSDFNCQLHRTWPNFLFLDQLSLPLVSPLPDSVMILCVMLILYCCGLIYQIKDWGFRILFYCFRSLQVRTWRGLTTASKCQCCIE